MWNWYTENILQPYHQARARGEAAGLMEAQAAQTEKYGAQLAELMGHPGVQATTAEDGLTAGGIEGRGIMAQDLADPNTQAMAGLGIMQIPGYEQFGANLLSQSFAHQLALPGMQRQQRQEQLKFELDTRKRLMEIEALDWEQANRVGPYDASGYQSALGSLTDDYLSHTDGLRDGLSRAQTTAARVAATGVTGMTVADDAGLIKAIVKLETPDEAMNLDDFATLSRTEGVPGYLRAILTNMGIGQKLKPYQRAELLRRLQDLTIEKSRELDDRRMYWTTQAQNAQIRNFQLLPALRMQGNDELADQIEKNWNMGRAADEEQRQRGMEETRGEPAPDGDGIVVEGITFN